MAESENVLVTKKHKLKIISGWLVAYLDPCHKEVDVLWGRTFDWLLHLVSICPMILKRERLSPADKCSIIQRFQILCLSTICNVQLPTSYLGPALITGQDSSVQNSVMVPYNMLIWLKKSTVFTATHLRSVVM